MMHFLKILVFLVVLVLSFYLITVSDVKALSDQTLFIKLALASLSGLFYTSFLAAPLSIVLIIVLSQTTNIYLIALFAGFGAVLGDLMIVKFFRSVFRTFSFVVHTHFFHRVKKKLQSCHLDLLAYVLGIIIVASPFPDELGLILLGASQLSYFKLAVLTFILNSIGILLVLYTAKVF